MNIDSLKSFVQQVADNYYTIYDDNNFEDITMRRYDNGTILPIEMVVR